MFMLGVVPPEGEYAGRLSIPYMTPGGVVAIRYRAMADEQPKYLAEAGTSVHLYNAQVLIHASDLVVVTEGEMDAMVTQAYTGLAAVGYPGVDTWQKQQGHWRLCFEGVTEVVVIADGDDVGRKAAQRVSESIGMHARVVHMPDGDDSNSFIASQGASAFIERITQ